MIKIPYEIIIAMFIESCKWQVLILLDSYNDVIWLQCVYNCIMVNCKLCAQHMQPYFLMPDHIATYLIRHSKAKPV